MKQTLLACFLCIFSFSAFAQDEQTETSIDEEQYQQALKIFIDALKKHTGTVQLPSANASLNVPENFYFLDAADSKKVLVDLWGNPGSDGVMGMLFPAEFSPADRDSWAVTISYEDTGYVPDEDANDIDYNDLLVDMKKDTRNESTARVQQGYEPIELVGWAEKPYYDRETNKLHWAKEIKFGDQGSNTLNYNIRVLGRKGVLVLNFVAGMEQLPQIKEKQESVLQIANFNAGSRYSDFDSSVDKVAAYGIGALIAGKVISKTGIFAVLIMLLKKFGIFIVVGLGALAKSLIGRKSA